MQHKNLEAGPILVHASNKMWVLSALQPLQVSCKAASLPGHRTGCTWHTTSQGALRPQQMSMRAAAPRGFAAAAVPGSGAVAADAAASATAGHSWQVLEHVGQLPDKYQGVLLDQFGVLHDGEKPYPGAIEAVSQLAARGLRLLIISNSSRRAHGALSNLARMGFDESCFWGVITSGEVTHRHLEGRPTDWWRQLGRRCLHLTWGARGAISLGGLSLEVPTTDPQHAEFILAHGTEALGTSLDGSAAEPCSLEGMQAKLSQCASRGGLPMVVANPDLVTVAGSELRTMPGTLARYYASQGGQVVLMGKPAPLIYETALDMLGLPPQAVIAIGDSLEHDIAGAQCAQIDTAFVMAGIHRDDVQLQPQHPGAECYSFSSEQLAAACASHAATPTYLLPFFK